MPCFVKYVLTDLIYILYVLSPFYVPPGERDGVENILDIVVRLYTYVGGHDDRIVANTRFDSHARLILCFGAVFRFLKFNIIN